MTIEEAKDQLKIKKHLTYMENINKKPKTKSGQGKTPQQYEDSTKFAGYSLILMIILLILMTLLSSCTGTYYLSQYDDHYNESMQADRASITYYNDQIYWGWQSGYYYYYGKPHYYPWYYYYTMCPPIHYNTTTHVIINRPVNKPTHKPIHSNNRGNVIIKTNANNNNVIIKNNTSNRSIIKNVSINKRRR